MEDKLAHYVSKAMIESWSLLYGCDTPTWQDTDNSIKELANKIRSYSPEIAIGIGKAGIYPAYNISEILNTSLDFIYTSRARIQMRVLRKISLQTIPFLHNWWYDTRVRDTEPILIKKYEINVAGKKVIVVDDIAHSGKSLRFVSGLVKDDGASEVRTAALGCIDYEPDYFVKRADLSKKSDWGSLKYIWIPGSKGYKKFENSWKKEHPQFYPSY